MTKGSSIIKKSGLFLIGIAAVISSAVFWVKGFLYSPLFDSEFRIEEKFIGDFIDSNSLDSIQEKILAESYWLRYSDVRTNKYWGRNSPMGIWGPRDHFMQHGKREGRIFAPVIHPKDMAMEKKLAEAYWQRYPAIRSSPIWGEKTKIGYLGPRDHFQYRGRYQGYIWEADKIK